MAKLMPPLVTHFDDDNGRPLAGGKVYFYEAGTSTPKNTFTDANSNIANPNPVVLDARGEASIWLTAGDNYKAVVKRADDSTVRTIDNVTRDAADDATYIAMEAAEAARDVAIEQAGIATYQAGIAADEASAAATSESNAETAQALAEAAQSASAISAAAALAASNTYADTAAGLAATVDGDVFLVVTANPQVFNVYDNQSGTAVLLGQLNIADGTSFVDDVPVGAVFSISDGDGMVAFAILSDGTVKVDSLLVEDILVDTLSVNDDSSVVGNESSADSVFDIADGDGNVALKVADDGSVETGNIRSIKFNNKDAIDFLKYTRTGRALSHERNFILTGGQSLAVGATSSALTTNREYDSTGYTFRAIGSEIPANTGISSGLESPLFGTLGFIKESLEKQDGVDYLADNYQLIGYVNGESATSITQHLKSTANYNFGISALQAATNLSDLFGQQTSFQAFTWTQGNANSGMAVQTYVDHLKSIINDYNDDAKAITGQYNDVICITYQIPIRPIANAHLAASDQSSRIFCACPGYHFVFSDGVHLVNTSYKHLGAYYGMVYKKVVIDKEDWQPLRPKSWNVRGNVIDIFFNKNGLVFDTTIVPAQSNFGFRVNDSGGTAKTISSVQIVSSNVVRLTMAATVNAGDVFLYGVTATGRSDSFTGLCGNLRDRQGDTLIYESDAGNTPINAPMHNWCVIFDVTV